MLDELEKARLSYIKKKKEVKFLLLVIDILLVLIITFIMSLSTGIEVDVVIFNFFFFGLIIYCFGFELLKRTYINDYNKFVSLYKNGVVKMALSKAFEDVSIDSTKGIDRRVVECTGIILNKYSFESNDYITGKYKNINFITSDVEIYEPSGDGSPTIIFKGQWYIFDFNKIFKDNVLVFCNDCLRKNDKELIIRGKKYSRIDLEDIEFNKKFSVYSDNSEEAFYIMTPKMMKTIETKENLMNNHYFFVDNKLYIGVNSCRDAFEVSENIPVNKETIKDAVSEIIDDMQPIIDLIDLLELDNDLFKKQ